MALRLKFVLMIFMMAQALLQISCADSSVYLLPEKVPGREVKSGDQINILIRPIYTSDFQSEDREKYLFDFSSHFTAIEIRIHNGSPDLVQWSPAQTVLKDAKENIYAVLNEDEAFHYYKDGDSGGKEITILEKPYERQKEDIENIKRFMIKPSSISPGGEVTGLLLFKKIPLNDCDNVELIVGGIVVAQVEKSVKFSLKCPKS